MSPYTTDIICLSETKLNCDSNLDKIQIQNYEFLLTNSPLCFGGTGIYINKSILYKRRLDLEFGVEGCETTFVEVDSGNHCRNTIVAVIYRHPLENHQQFFQEMELVVQKIVSKYNIVFLGDINIDVSSSNCDGNGKKYQDLLLSLNLKNLISKPTRITTSSETIIDHVITNIPYEQCKSGVLVNNITDHLPIYTFCIISSQRKKYRNIRTPIRKIKTQKRTDSWIHSEIEFRVYKYKVILTVSLLHY